MIELREIYRHIGKASGIIIIITLTDKLLAVTKEIFTAHYFGVSPALDVFNIAYAFPGIISLIISGALISAFVPLYIEWSNKLSPQQANSDALSVMFIAFLLLGLITALCYLLSPVILTLVGYGFGPKERALGIAVERFLVFLILIEGTGILFASILQARKRFFDFQVSFLFVNIAIIISLVFFQKRLGIHALVWGFLLGTLCKIIYMAVALHRNGFHLFSKIVFDRSKLLAFFYLVLPLLGSELVVNVNLLIDQVMATQLPAGSVSTLRYAFRINDMPIQIIILAVAVAIFPFISERALEKDYDGLRHLFNQSVIFLGFLTFPIISLVTLFAQDVVGILFQRGAFDIHATEQTAETFFFYSLGLFFLSYTFINSTFFSGLKDTKPLFYIGCLSTFMNILLNLLFMSYFGVKGIALSTTITMLIVSLISVFLLNRRIKIVFSRLISNLLRIIIASTCALGLGFGLKWLSIDYGIDRLLYVPLITIVVLLCYLLVCWILKTEELIFFMNLFRKEKASNNESG